MRVKVMTMFGGKMWRGEIDVAPGEFKIGTKEWGRHSGLIPTPR